MIGFSSPVVLILLLIVPLLYFIHRFYTKKKKRQAMQFSSVSYLKSAMKDTKQANRHRILLILSLLIIASIVIGLADPHIPLKQTKQGVNVVLVIDVSGSMQAQDYSPNRLEAAKRSAEVLVESLESKDHVGIVTFQTGATTAAYLTPDKKRAINKLRGITPKDGQTAIGDGLSLGIDMAVSIPNKRKVVILLSDGVNNAGVITPTEAVGFARSNDIQVYTIGLGSEEAVVLGYDFFGRAQYAELDEGTLRAIAEQTGGQYYKSVDVETLDEIYKNISDEIEREPEQTSIKDWFFILAGLLVLVQIWMRYGGKRIIQ